MARNKSNPLPPLSNPKPTQGEPAPARPPAETPITLLNKEGKPIALALPHTLTTLAAQNSFDHYAMFCPAKEDSFKNLAEAAATEGWELISVVPHERFMVTDGGSGKHNGWMTFWKRLRRES